MCGIVGYAGKRDLKQIVIDGLCELEYRGYDSAGIAINLNGTISSYKAVGKLENLIHKTENLEANGTGLSIGHTRWATHGKPTELNAHPHAGDFTQIVHNGIIENYSELKRELQDKGVTFLSQTDTEVIVHLFEENYKNNPNIFEAFIQTKNMLIGAYALLLITQNDNETIYFAKQGSPLVIGTGENENFFASSDAPIIGEAKDAIYLHDGEYGKVTQNSIKIYNDGQLITPKSQALPTSKTSAQKEGHRFFMEKEIYEQSNVINDTIMGRINENKIVLEELNHLDLTQYIGVTICACGTSYHAAMSSTYLFERIAKIRATTVIASEFRYKEPLLDPKELFIVISQSGETADTLEALKMAKAAGMQSLAICNVDNSSIVRLADATLLTRAGIEKGVASTKAFATQMMTLWMLVLQFAQKRESITPEKLSLEIQAIKQSHTSLEITPDLHERLKRLSKRYLHGHGFFFIGRDIFFPLALEGALKLKEISYLHAEGYPAGEMKHGPIALADTELFTIALMPKTLHYEKIKSNVEELSARDSTICAITSQEFDLADDLVKIANYNHPMLEYYSIMTIMQLLSMEIAVRLGNDVDMPRNLAKSVTVE
jgi:glutamine---fructose-6-phosphate transaminase (isomerizing)